MYHGGAGGGSLPVAGAVRLDAASMALASMRHEGAHLDAGGPTSALRPSNRERARRWGAGAAYTWNTDANRPAGMTMT
jgi:hypothetical protein